MSIDKTTLVRINQTASIAGSVFAGLLVLTSNPELTAEGVAQLRAASISHADQIYKDTITHIMQGGQS